MTRCAKIRNFVVLGAKKMGVGFAVPKSLKAVKTKSDKIVVRRVVRHAEAIPQK